MVYHRNLSGAELHYARVRTGTGDPNGVVDASIAGEIYIDTSTNTAYYSTDAGNSNWVQFGGSGGGTLQATYHFVFDVTNVSSGATYYILKTKTPMYTDKNYFRLYDRDSGSDIPDSDYSFSTAPSAHLGRLSDLTDTIFVSNSYNGPIDVYYTEYVNPIIPMFYLARSDSNPVSTTNFIDAYYDPDVSRRTISSVSYDNTLMSVTTTDNNGVTKTYYYPTRLYYTFGNITTGLNWRIEGYKPGRAKRGSGAGATTGLRVSNPGHRTAGLGSFSPQFASNPSDGYLDLTSVFDYTSLFSSGEANRNIGPRGTFWLRLRDTSTNTVTLFGMQKLRVINIRLYRRDSPGNYFIIPRIYLRW